MTVRSLVIGCARGPDVGACRECPIGATAGACAAARKPTAAPQPAAAAPAQVRPTATTTTAITADAQRAFFKPCCVGCHNEGAAKAGMDSSRKLQIDALDFANVDKDRKTWELIVRKVRAGQMPPVGIAAAGAAGVRRAHDGARKRAGSHGDGCSRRRPGCID